MIRVACSAVIVEDGKVYLIQEQKEVAKDLRGLPGGKLEEGESLEECVRREVLEETGIELETAELFKIVNKPHSREGNTVVKCVFVCHPANSQREIAEMEGRYYDLDEIENLSQKKMLRGDELPILCREALTRTSVFPEVLLLTS